MTDNTIAPEVAEGMRKLIQELVPRLAAGLQFDNPHLNALADEAFGGTRAAGVYTCRDEYDALETAVNRFLLESKARNFMQAKAEPLQSLRALLEQLPTQTDRTIEQTEFQQFSTPPTIAFLAAQALSLQTDDVVLEPSAGTGSLAIWPRALGLGVICNEISPRRRALLNTLGFDSLAVDAEMIHDLLPEEIKPTAVLMNPPFSATAGRVSRNDSKYGLLHVESVLRRLEDGGRLVAVLGESVSFERSKTTSWWHKLMEQYTVRANIGLSGNEYAKYGTAVSVQLVVIDKVGPTPGRSWDDKLKGVIWGSGHSAEKAFARLEKLAPRLRKGSEPASQGASTTPPTLFVPYFPGKIQGGTEHPAVIVESASMAAVVPPDITYKPCLPKSLVTEGKLSIIQWERVI